MSAALVRESLELVESSGKKKSGPNDAKVLHRKKKQHSVVEKKLKHKVVSSGGKQLSMEDLRMRLRVHEDRTEGNVRMLQKLGDRSTLDESAINKIFQRAVKTTIELPSSAPKEGTTVFTDEDFEKFEQEYFVN